MAAKQLLFHDPARDSIRRGIDALAEAVKVTRLALQNAGSIAALMLTTDCMIANSPASKAAAAQGMAAMSEPY